MRARSLHSIEFNVLKRSFFPFLSQLLWITKTLQMMQRRDNNANQRAATTHFRITSTESLEVEMNDPRPSVAKRERAMAGIGGLNHALSTGEMRNGTACKLERHRNLNAKV